ncbi:htl family protein [Megaselia abdita]
MYLNSSWLLLLLMVTGFSCLQEDKDSCNIAINKSRTQSLLPKPSGNTIKLNCIPMSTKDMGNITVTWTVNDTKIERKMGTVNHKRWSIELPDALPEDSGMYKCKMCTTCKCVEEKTKVIIQDRFRHKPVIKKMDNITILVNSTMNHSCITLFDDLEAHFTWYKSVNVTNATDPKSCYHNEEMPDFTRRFCFKSVTDPESDERNTLSLENVTHEDEGYYICTAANSLGSTAEKIYVQVLDELPTEAKMKSHTMMIIAISVFAILSFFLISFSIVMYKKIKNDELMKHRIETVHQWTKKVVIYKPSADPNDPDILSMPVVTIEKQRTMITTKNSDSIPFNEYEFPLDSNWEIDRNKLNLGENLGEGEFGRVVKATATDFIKANNKCNIVAVKMVKEGHTDADMASLVREMEVMKMIGQHINIINLVGCCSQEGPLYVVVEYASHGNLKNFLLKHKNTDFLDQERLLSFSYQVARGMEYLASRRCIHRDLAARNVLVCDDYIIKIADFGLARDIQDTDYYRKNTNGRLPIKWMAPESLQEKFYDTKSDVWSYGVLLWEIYSYGEQPYKNVATYEELLNYLHSNERLDQPPGCSLNM